MRLVTSPCTKTYSKLTVPEVGVAGAPNTRPEFDLEREPTLLNEFPRERRPTI